MRFLLGLFCICLSCSSVPLDPSAEQLVNWQNNYLRQLAITDRISSNHYSDIVMDSAANSYIACFQKGADAQDYLLILKVSPQGDILWTIGQQTKGRALAIAIGPQDKIWISGRFTDRLQLGEQDIHQPGDHAFIAGISPDGQCHELILPEGNCLISDIAVNPQGAILIGGLMSTELHIGQRSFRRSTGSSDSQFLALINPDLSCSWIKPLRGQVLQTAASPSGQFYISGRFTDSLLFDMHQLHTQDRREADAFLLQVDAARQSSWLVQLGKKGSLSSGYRVQESGNDLAFTATGEVLVLGLHEHEPSAFDGLMPEYGAQIPQLDIYLWQLNAQGQIRKQQSIHGPVHPQIQTLVSDGQNGWWISGQSNKPPSLDQPPRLYSGKPLSFLLHLDEHFNIDQSIPMQHGSNTLFRAVYGSGSKISWAGHFQEHLQIAGDSLANDGRHGLFNYSISPQGE